jgi:recombination protein RecT
MSNNQLSLYKFGELTEVDVQTIRETIAKDCNDSQFRLFMSIAKNALANPILNEIFPSVFGGKLTVQFGIDFYVRKAKETEGYLGYDVQLVHENDEVKMHQERAEDGRYYIVIDDHSIGFPRGKVIAGYAIAYKEGFKPFTVLMEVDEVEHYKRSKIGMQQTMWTNNFNDMFKKHMVRRALKAAFGLNFDDDQVENKTVNDVPEYHPRKDITPNQEIIDAPSSEPEQPHDDEASKLKAVRKEVEKKFKKLGITKDDQKAYVEKHVPGFNGSLSDFIGLSQLLDMQIDMESVQPADDDLLD